MSFRTRLLLVALILAGCATRPNDPQAPANRCAPEQGWRDGTAGREPPPACAERAEKIWLEAYNLGRRQHEFTAELARLDARIETLSKSEDEADQAAARRAGLERVRLIRELEAIRGAAQIRGWVD